MSEQDSTTPRRSLLDDYLAGKSDAEKAAIYTQVTGQAHQVPTGRVEDGFGQLIRAKGYVGALRDLFKKPDLTEDINRTRRQRELAMLADLAKVGTQAWAAGRGARQFQPLQSQVPYYEQQLQRMRDAQRGYDIDYAQRLFNAEALDWRDAQAADAARKDREMELAKMQAEDERYAADQAFKVRKAAQDYALAQQRIKADTEATRAQQAETARHNRSTEASSWARVRQSGGASDYYGRFRDKDYRTRADYEEAVLRAAREYGIPEYTKVTTGEIDVYTGQPKQKAVRKAIATIAAEVAKRDDEEKKANKQRKTMPGV